jgi:signal transduction histidine kinase/CheY-like chemotaxis protein
MANILIVDDRQENREFLATLLGYQGHTLRQASDGLEALQQVRAQTPDLVISDVLMPTMDGYEFVLQLRGDPRFTNTPVIFCTAHYLEREATSLAEKSGVRYVLRKPCEPQEVLSIVAAALGGEPLPLVASDAEQDLGHEHLRLLTDQLSRKVEELRLATLRLSALMEVCRQLSYERDPEKLVEGYARAARDIVGAGGAGIRIGAHGGWKQIATSGFDDKVPKHLSWGGTEETGDATLTVPVRTPTQTYGWLWLVKKLGSEEFLEEDTSVALALAGQLAVAYENASLNEELRRHAEILDQRVEEKAARLAEANAALATVTYAVSHELRAPVRRAGMFLELLLSRMGPLPDQVSELADQAGREIRMMRELVEELLDLSRAEFTKATATSVDIRELVDEVIGDLKLQTQSRKIAWRIGPLPVIFAYRRLLKQALYNLLENALKFTSKQPQAVIEIGEAMEGGRRAIYVRDDGVGFDPGAAHRLFGVFERLHSEEEYPGTGLGLAITKAIIRRHGGDIWAEASAGKGATFWFTLTPQENASGGSKPADRVPDVARAASDR